MCYDTNRIACVYLIHLQTFLNFLFKLGNARERYFKLRKHSYHYACYEVNLKTKDKKAYIISANYNIMAFKLNSSESCKLAYTSKNKRI